ncbi:MAG: tetraacyldisaccharide 4'-kinase [Acidobacteriota bacterium]|nr:tetraacyldisaccharide 4'-kinase [Acidobacteriota bacterium]
MKYLLSRLYGFIVSLRVFLYQRGTLSSQQLPHPVISVGNLTVGGTGKTPLVSFLAQILKKAGYQPIILTRGYKRRNPTPILTVSDGKKILCSWEDSGDEPYLLARNLEGVPVVVSKNRYQAGRSVQHDYSDPIIYLLDDGYQHLQLKRNLNILLLDATDPFGGGQLLPRGRLRESTRGLKRADAIIITRSHIPFEMEAVNQHIRKWNPWTPITYFHHDATSLYDLKTGEQQSIRRGFGKRVIALAAIGNPRVFLSDLEHYQMKIQDRFIFRDHHPYTQSDLDGVLDRLTDLQAAMVVTTQKDSVRLEHLNFEESQIFVLGIEAVPENLAEYKKEFLDQVKGL